MIRTSDVVKLIYHHFPTVEIHSVEDRGTWVRRIFIVTLKNGGKLVVKFHVVTDWMDATLHEKITADILRVKNMPHPQVLVADASGELSVYPYIIMVAGQGERLDRLIQRLPTEAIEPIYEAIGRFYRRLHQIRGPKSGVWLDDPMEVFATAPSAYMLENELRQGSTQKLVEMGLMPGIQQQRMVELWEKNLGFLQEHAPVMVHGSAFPWTIYMEESQQGWQVSRIGSLGDSLWWDPAYDLAFLIDPPFTWMFDSWRDAFWRGYGQRADAGRLMLYRLLQIPCAVTDVYMQPEAEQNESWKQHALAELPQLILGLENRF